MNTTEFSIKLIIQILAIKYWDFTTKTPSGYYPYRADLPEEGFDLSKKGQLQFLITQQIHTIKQRWL
jgi:hypothetical protein